MSKHTGCLGEGCPLCPKLDLPGYEAVRAHLTPQTKAAPRPELQKDAAGNRYACVHRGGPTGAVSPCVGCGQQGKTQQPLACTLHGRCVPLLAVEDRGVRVCARCPDRQAPGVRAAAIAAPAPGVLEMGGAGIGDGLLGMLAAEGLRRARPELKVSYRCGPAALPYVRLFAGWADARPSARSHTEDAVPGAAQLNAGYSQEHFSPETRAARYCRNAGAPGPALPALADAVALRARGGPWRGAVLLAPFSTQSLRNWPLQNWVALERRLTEAGCRTVILHSSADRCELFAGERLLGADAATVAGAVLCADGLVGNDSGMAHLAGALGTPAVAVCVPPYGAKVYSAYPSVLALDGLKTLLPADVHRHALPHLWRHVTPHTLQSPDKLQQLARCARETAPLGGAVAELGVYRGGTALLLCRAAAGRPAHLFDTFTGIPGDDTAPGGKHRAGEFACGQDAVCELLKDHHARLHAGLFPATAAGLEGERFSLVHLDADTEQSTRAALEWFAARMLPGGMIVLDDYLWPHTPGVARALGACGLLGRAEPLARYQCRVRF